MNDPACAARVFVTVLGYVQNKTDRRGEDKRHGARRPDAALLVRSIIYKEEK